MSLVPYRSFFAIKRSVSVTIFLKKQMQNEQHNSFPRVHTIRKHDFEQR